MTDVRNHEPSGSDPIPKLFIDQPRGLTLVESLQIKAGLASDTLVDVATSYHHAHGRFRPGD